MESTDKSSSEGMIDAFTYKWEFLVRIIVTPSLCLRH